MNAARSKNKKRGRLRPRRLPLLQPIRLFRITD